MIMDSYYIGAGEDLRGYIESRYPIDLTNSIYKITIWILSLISGSVTPYLPQNPSCTRTESAIVCGFRCRTTNAISEY